MEKERIGVIYKITNLLNNKVYIGQTKRPRGFKGRYPFKGEGIERVFNTLNANKRNGESYNAHLYNSIEKYGFVSFLVIEEFDVAYTIEELNEKEEYWIRFYKATDSQYGYNQAIGGNNFRIGKAHYIENIGKKWKPLWCTNTKEIFLTASDAAKEYNIHESGIRNTCMGIQKEVKSSIGRLKFKYIVRWNELIVCVNTREVFTKVTEAGLKYNVDYRQISKNARGLSISAGKHPLTKEKLKWEYGIEYKLNQVYGQSNEVYRIHKIDLS